MGYIPILETRHQRQLLDPHPPDGDEAPNGLQAGPPLGWCLRPRPYPPLSVRPTESIVPCAFGEVRDVSLSLPSAVWMDESGHHPCTTQPEGNTRSASDPASIRTRVMSALAAYDVRVLYHDGAAWFPVNDLVSALGVHRRTLDHYVGHLPDSERRHLPRPSRLLRDITIGNAGLHCVSLAGCSRCCCGQTAMPPPPSASGCANRSCCRCGTGLWSRCGLTRKGCRHRLQDASGGRSAPPLVRPTSGGLTSPGEAPYGPAISPVRQQVRRTGHGSA